MCVVTDNWQIDAPSAPSPEEPAKPGQASGSPSTQPGFDPNAYLAANADIKTEADRVVGTGEFASAEDYAAHHYDVIGKDENRPGSPGYVAPVKGPDPVAPEDPITSMTKGFQTTVDKLAQSGTDLTTLITGMQKDFATSQQDLLNQMQSTADNQSKAFAAALKDLANAGNASGQAAKKPNYARAMARNRELNGGGLSATMLTGAGGVAPGALSLGTTSLLGSV